MKILILFFYSIICIPSLIAQKVEHINCNWPAEYKWKIVAQENDSSHQSVTIIPGNQNIKNVQIIGNVAGYPGVKYDNIDQIVDYYKKALDEGSVLTVLEKQDSIKHDWVIFKIETPRTPKYPEPESDLYYVTQGDYALYATWVAVKKESLDSVFIDRWTKIFKACEIEIQ